MRRRYQQVGGTRYRPSMADMTPSSPEVSARMAKVRNRGTAAEMAIRRELHRQGMRYRVNPRMGELGRTSPDIAFTRMRVAIFVDGCFWHQCPAHATFPHANSDWWAEKLDMNVQRDTNTSKRLEGLGWTVIRIWEHEDPIEAVNRIRTVIESLQ